MFTITTRQRLGVFLVFALCMFLPACGNKKVTQANLDKIKTGMTLQEVEAILGPGKKDDSGDGSMVAAQAGVALPGVQGAGNKGVDIYVWESGDKEIRVYFNSGKVTQSSGKGLESKKK